MNFGDYILSCSCQVADIGRGTQKLLLESKEARRDGQPSRNHKVKIYEQGFFCVEVYDVGALSELSTLPQGLVER